MKYVLPKKPRKSFKKNDIVDTFDRLGIKMETVKVISVTKKLVVTSCGRSWDQDGWWIGTNGTWPWPFIRHSRRKTFDSVKV